MWSGMPATRYFSALAATALLGSGTPATADTVTLYGKPPFRNVEVLGFQDGRLSFRGVSEQVLRKPLAEVEFIELDRDPRFSEADRLRLEDPAAALTAYEAARNASGDGWLQDVIDLRRIGVLDRLGRFDDAVVAWLEQLRRAPDAAGGLAPRSLTTASPEALTSAIQLLAGATPRVARGDARDAVRTLLLECTLAAGEAPAPEQFVPAPEGDAAAALAPASAPAPPGEAPPLLFGDLADADKVVRLAGDSAVFALAEQQIEQGRSAQAERLLRRALPFVAGPGRAGPEILLQRARIERGQAASAADALLEIAAACRSAGREDLAGEAVYYCGLAHERLDRPEVARAYYQDVLKSDAAAERVRERARARLTALGE